MNITTGSIIALVILSAVHLCFIKNEFEVWRKKLFAFSSGISVAYVFIDLLPKLSRGETIWSESNPNLPFLEKHVYFLALLGFLFFLGIDFIRTNRKKISFWIPASSYLIYNVLIGYAISNPEDPEIQPFVLFTIAIALHLKVRDHILRTKDNYSFKNLARFLLALGLVAGWILGLVIKLDYAAIALIIAFIGGGMMVNILHFETKSFFRSKHFLYFILGSLLYSILLLFLG
ncbi:MAG: hypothetical protein WCT85_02285 [Parachlamydiales bacterium]|jgi:hypothetical protein